MVIIHPNIRQNTVIIIANNNTVKIFLILDFEDVVLVSSACTAVFVIGYLDFSEVVLCRNSERGSVCSILISDMA